MRNAIQKTADTIIADYKEHYAFPWQGESHMHDCIVGALEESDAVLPQIKPDKMRRQRDELLAALRDLADRDWTYTGAEADTGNQDSLYNRIKRARQTIQKATS